MRSLLREERGSLCGGGRPQGSVCRKEAKAWVLADMSGTGRGVGGQTTKELPGKSEKQCLGGRQGIHNSAMFMSSCPERGNFKDREVSGINTQKTTELVNNKVSILHMCSRRDFCQ